MGGGPSSALLTRPVHPRLTLSASLRRPCAVVSVGTFEGTGVGLLGEIPGLPASLDFARACARSAIFERDQSTRPENLLSIVDRRTIAKFVRKSGGTRTASRLGCGLSLSPAFITNREASRRFGSALAGPRQAMTRHGNESAAILSIVGVHRMRAPRVRLFAVARCAESDTQNLRSFAFRCLSANRQWPFCSCGGRRLPMPALQTAAGNGSCEDIDVGIYTNTGNAMHIVVRWGRVRCALACAGEQRRAWQCIWR
jgi:hypothetical protein